MPGVGSIDELDARGSLKASYARGKKMPYTPKQRDAARIAEHIKERGGESTAFKGMSAEALHKYSHEPLEKKKGSAAAQGRALKGKRGKR